MKNLFKMNSSVTIDEFVVIRITGPYTLLKLGPDYAAVRSGDHVIEATGEDLIVETLSEELAVFSFEAISTVSMKEVKDGQGAYDS
ncbi:hypothetical protein QTL97_10615 [Sporosarcina thermotolerans]|uniref:DUF2187 domain-containing protein n=1 Tax=Sporosarcina thermotolerans TaxID=633404 RepID=A0AAW9ACL3_9BACL|nr:hypothetical protein [Sporosarcina thermotolerans]MDW0117388.1 hypothetical protein [Sporosarcina thermotolerans]WHT47525.1 hypothetical protein QNH10_15365 [Sporosarcina thermotolerans]